MQKRKIIKVISLFFGVISFLASSLAISHSQLLLFTFFQHHSFGCLMITKEKHLNRSKSGKKFYKLCSLCALSLHCSFGSSIWFSNDWRVEGYFICFEQCANDLSLCDADEAFDTIKSKIEKWNWSEMKYKMQSSALCRRG